jgi:transposase
MKQFIQGENRTQATMFPELLDDYVAGTNPVQVVDVFVNELDLGQLGFDDTEPAETGRPAYHPAALLKLYIYGYLNRIQSSRRLERERKYLRFIKRHSNPINRILLYLHLRILTTNRMSSMQSNPMKLVRTKNIQLHLITYFDNFWAH